jgi:PAS domain S-box-containing protein
MSRRSGETVPVTGSLGFGAQDAFPGTLSGSYDPVLVLLSVGVAVLSSFTALALAGRVSTASHRLRFAWLAGGALALGIGMWAMHFVGMLSFRIPAIMAYRVDYLVVALTAAVVSALLALLVVSRTEFSMPTLLAGAALLGMGFVAMHVLGMRALYTTATVTYRPELLLASVVVAVGVSLCALGLAWRSRDSDSPPTRRRRAFAAVGVGAAMAGMHYTAMAAAQFHPVVGPVTVPPGALLATHGLAAAVIVATVSVVGVALAGALGDRYIQGYAAQLAQVRASEQALREAEERQRIALETGRFGSFELELATNAVAFSDLCKAQHGFPAGADVTLAAVLARIHPEDRARFETDIDRAFAGRGTLEIEYRVVWPDGSLRWIQARGRVIDAVGQPRMVGVKHDVTASKRAEEERVGREEALRHSEERHRALVTATSSVVWTSDALGAFIEPQLSWEAYTGQPWAEHQGFGWTAALHPDDRESLSAGWSRSRERLSVHEARGRLWCRRTGGYRHFIIRAAPTLRADGAVREWIGTVTDVEEHWQVEERLRQVDRMEALGQLAGGIAHEANNQMSVVLGCAAFILKHPDLPVAVQQDALQVRRAAERTAAITAQLLAFSRRQMLQPKVLDLNELVRGLESILGRTLGERGDLVLDLDATLGPIRADPGQLEQVLLNLTLNARDAMPRGGTFTIETRPIELTTAEGVARPDVRIEPGTYAGLVVSDTGQGMDRATVARIFEPFFTTKGTGEGTGLGLSTVYGIVKQSGGYIWAYSEPGQGTTFWIYLPLAPEARPTADPAASAALPARPGETALVVEDDPLMRAIAVRALVDHGYSVIEAERASAALDLLAAHSGRVDVVVTDVAMPGLGGRELAARLAEIRPGIAVLYMSGYTDQDVVRRGLLEEGQPFLRKPFAPQELARRVHEVLHQSRLEAIGGATRVGEA